LPALCPVLPPARIAAIGKTAAGDEVYWAVFCEQLTYPRGWFRKRVRRLDGIALMDHLESHGIRGAVSRGETAVARILVPKEGHMPITENTVNLDGFIYDSLAEVKVLCEERDPD